MGTEIVFVVIYPLAIFCLLIAIWSWFDVAKSHGPNVRARMIGYLPILVGFVVSLLCLTIITYLECDSDFTSLVKQEFYAENQRKIFLPGRVSGQELINLLFALPFICVFVVPLTARLVRKKRLTIKSVFSRAVIGWVLLAFACWLFDPVNDQPAYSLSYFIGSAGIWILFYGLPVPVAAIFLMRQNLKT